jgi:hypothetical protein
VVDHSCNHSSQKAEAGGSQDESEASLGYTVRLCSLKTKKNRTRLKTLEQR